MRVDRSDLIASRITASAAVVACAIGLIVITGWAADVDAMRRLVFGSIHMLPNTAVGFVAAAAALWLQRRPGVAGPRARWTARVLAAAVLALGGLTFGERVFGWDFGIDRLLFPDLLRRHPYRPLGRMATNSTVAFTLAGAALLTIDVVTRRGRRPGQWLATLGLGIASLALVGYLYDTQVLYSFDSAAAMALATAIAFVAIHLGILFARPAGGASLLLSQYGGGILARRLLAAVLLVPLVLGWMFIRARYAEIVSREVGIAILVVAVIAILLAVSLRAASLVQTVDRARQATLEREAAAREEAESANRAKNDFLAVMSHELRTPLNAIIGYGSLLAEGIPDAVTDAQRQQLSRIASSARHLLALIDEVLTLSRIELGEERVVPTKVAVAAVVEEAAAMVEPQARAKGLRFDVEQPDASLTLETDAKKLRQALVNLLGNAVKFTDRGGVRLRVAAERDGDNGGDMVLLAVEDTGLGIAAEHLDRVFDSFWQVDQARSRRAGGVGLGLHVTRQLTRLLGGEVSVRSTVGEGSCFVLRVPRHWWGTATPAPVRVIGARLSAVETRARSLTPP